MVNWRRVPRPWNLVVKFWFLSQTEEDILIFGQQTSWMKHHLKEQNFEIHKIVLSSHKLSISLTAFKTVWIHVCPKTHTHTNVLIPSVARHGWYYSSIACTTSILSNLQGGIWDFWPFWQILDLLKKLWTMLDLSVCHVAQRSRYLTKHQKKVLKISKNWLPHFHI